MYNLKILLNNEKLKQIRYLNWDRFSVVEKHEHNYISP